MNFEGTRSSLNVELWSWYAIPKALLIKMDTQKLFTFTVRDGNFTNVNLNFLC